MSQSVQSSGGTITKKKLRRRKFREPQQAWKKLRSIFRPLEEQNYMKYRRVLGFGGFGIVQLWDINNEKGERARSVAIKTPIKPDDNGNDLKREIWWTKRFTGSEHLVQLVDLGEKARGIVDYNNENSTGPPIMVMEELGQGSLDLMMSRIKYMKAINHTLPENERALEYIPNTILWSIFLCLTRACIGMAYPPVSPESGQGASNRETMSGAPPIQDSNYVHNDIDVGNIFVANPIDHPRDNEHPWAPIVKIADYGCMVQWDDNWGIDQKMSSLWGKPAYKAPEQLGTRALRRGAVGTHTNVYQIGQVMHDLITLERIPYGDRAKLIRELPDGADMDTYGWRLLDFEGYYKIEEDWANVDFELRTLAAGCMADLELERPPLGHLEHIILNRLSNIYQQANDARQGLNPPPAESVPGQPSPAAGPDLYKNRVPMWEVEPDTILNSFCKDYFESTWGDTDRYREFWSKPTVPTKSPTQPLQPGKAQSLNRLLETRQRLEGSGSPISYVQHGDN
ncbi:hypothetical protein NUW58_g5462 [Xylaria curta]|uniref:Uncharacterized protein n=1 Tax=Xylaria curta TaxID=42375 RepID=A0ACC1P4G3_9PEZI|nr:hypothetical protein NUW58_g5462 [Xylaria curta]